MKKKIIVSISIVLEFGSVTRQQSPMNAGKVSTNEAFLDDEAQKI